MARAILPRGGKFKLYLLSRGIGPRYRAVLFGHMRGLLKSIMPGSGGQGEDAAARYLKRQGFHIVERNWRHGRLEIDLICRDADYLVFVEVKTRGQSSMGTAAEALGRDKARRLVRAASQYLSVTGSWDDPCRFDLAAVSQTPDGWEVVLFQDVIDASDHA